MRPARHARRRAAWAVALTLAAGCSASGGAPARPSTPDPWSDALRLAHLEDTNPDPHVVEVSLEARPGEWTIAPGKTVHAMTYNGSVPGPLLEAHAGDSVIVHFTNGLSEPTTVHWHGVRVPNAMDGSPMTQTPVPPGGRFDYRFTVPDAGTFWYHPHIDEPKQMEYGLYGPIIVHGDGEPSFDHEGVVMLDDLKLGPDGQIAPVDVDPIEQHDGRDGPIQLVNGRTDVTVPIRAGESERWRIVNAGSARFYRLALAGHRFTLLGTDGGLLESPQDLGEVFMVPGDRLDVVISGTASPGTKVPLTNLPYSRGHGAGVTMATPVLTLAYTSDDPIDLLPAPSALRAPIAPIPTEGVTPRTITFDEKVDPVTGASTFTIDGQSYPNVPEIQAHVGTTEVWDLVNNSEMDHPFHLHGFFFQVVSQAGSAPPWSSWEDTYDLKGNATTRIVFLPDDRPGAWMYHCHILEHAAFGMMGDVNVQP
jgi:FtsP/CotA-like multicopper oxidase with cupredoxin domain